MCVSGLEAGEVGLVLTYAVTLIGNFQWSVRQSAEVENMMTSVERVVERTELKSEAPWETQKRPPADWPSRGPVTFNRVNSRDISATLQPHEKVRRDGRFRAREFTHMMSVHVPVSCPCVPAASGRDRGENGRREKLPGVGLVPPG
ncbi:multidrug resistance-associated protein 4-like isoform X1 [Seriola lalandi dorsalis]|uniref:multidrug resistance-associated protein 4-like isoform X1 n=1 Tax=Seriola lalandi dorsalis TaxID=1841481 RepID=UPI000C6F94B2|nr:multidrug resistance-associated protein 4-like isoform X1 [Seriola lalandi dorsalis]